MEITRTFRLFLPSNVPGEGNTLHNYTTQLSSRLIFNSPNWQVAATEISYPHSWYNLKQDSEVILVDDNNVRSGTQSIRIKAGFYDSPLKLVEAINARIKSKLKDTPEKELPGLKFSPESNKATPKKGKVNNVEVFASFKDDLREMLGLRDANQPTTIKKLYDGYSSDIISDIEKITLARNTNITFVDLNNVRYGDQNALIKAGKFKNVHHLIKFINAEVRKEVPVNPPSLRFEKISSRDISRGIVRHSPGEYRGQQFYLNFNDDLRKTLGIRTTEDKVSLTKFYETLTPYTLQVKAGFSCLYFYTNIVQHTLIGDTSAPILRRVNIPNHVEFQDQVNIEYVAPHYTPLATQEIDYIEIDIRDDTGVPVQFEDGRVSVTLEFRNG